MPIRITGMPIYVSISNWTCIFYWDILLTYFSNHYYSLAQMLKLQYLEKHEIITIILIDKVTIVI